MKNFTFLIALVAVAVFIFASCEQEQLQQVDQLEEPINLFEKELLVEDESGDNQVKLTFLSTSPVDAQELESTTYRLVSIPIEELATDLSTIEDNVVQDAATELSPIDLANAITVEMEVIQQTSNTALALQVERKASAVESRDCGHWYEPYWYTTRNTRRAYVKNLSHNSLNVQFYTTRTANPTTCHRTYPFGCVDRLRVNKTLYRNGAWYYYNCNLQVGALVSVNCSRHYHFQWLFWNVCGSL